TCSSEGITATMCPSSCAIAVVRPCLVCAPLYYEPAVRPNDTAGCRNHRRSNTCERAAELRAKMKSAGDSDAAEAALAQVEGRPGEKKLCKLYYSLAALKGNRMASSGKRWTVQDRDGD